MRDKLTSVQCACCDKVFRRTAGRVNEAARNGWKQYCGPECLSRTRVKRVTLACEVCGKSFQATPSASKRRRFCGTACANRHRGGNRPQKLCEMCKKPIKRSARKYCSNTCAQQFRYQLYVKRWLSGKETGTTKNSDRSSGVEPSKYVVRWLHETRGVQCEECGWHRVHPVTGKVPLQVHHIDGDGANTVPDNLLLLCGACHSLTTTYAGANKGNYPALA